MTPSSSPLRVRSKSMGPTMDLYRPISRAHALPDALAALPELGAQHNGARAAAGHPPIHNVYSYRWDAKAGAGSWQFLYHVWDGEEVTH